MRLLLLAAFALALASCATLASGRTPAVTVLNAPLSAGEYAEVEVANPARTRVLYYSTCGAGLEAIPPTPDPEPPRISRVGFDMNPNDHIANGVCTLESTQLGPGESSMHRQQLHPYLKTGQYRVRVEFQEGNGKGTVAVRSDPFVVVESDTLQ